MKKRHSIHVILAAAALLLVTAACTRRTNWRTVTVCPKDNTPLR